ncbi:hypothetical protein KP509_20G017500 [Ceratopteris richardii]|uniref:Uncharacterized protein n=1 Tax=Ceratopteris richardii TaxID=49495 RepID=A0A8T2SGI7_CERRI|nr:hypothetical protein KP509_20G017500 [Ceratopteris richardii]
MCSAAASTGCFTRNLARCGLFSTALCYYTIRTVAAATFFAVGNSSFSLHPIRSTTRRSISTPLPPSASLLLSPVSPRPWHSITTPLPSSASLLLSPASPEPWHSITTPDPSYASLLRSPASPWCRKETVSKSSDYQMYNVRPLIMRHTIYVNLEVIMFCSAHTTSSIS